MASSLHSWTPLLRSPSLSRALGWPVVLKLDNLQPPGSFKLRGIGKTVAKAARDGVKKVVSSSGGNAGFATAYAARALGLECTVVLPESTPKIASKRLEQFGADTQWHGSVWDEAHAHAEDIVMSLPEGYAALVHPFEGETTWEGHGSVVEEIASDIHPGAPAAIVTVVGGGGLLLGILRGLDKVAGTPKAGRRRPPQADAFRRVPVVAVETYGADSLSQSLLAGELVTLPGISSVAKSLGAATVSPTVFAEAMARRADLAGEGISTATGHENQINSNSVHSVVLDDLDAVRACLRFAEDHRMLVEPACGAGLAAVYQRALPLQQCVNNARRALGIGEEADVVGTGAGAGAGTDDADAEAEAAAAAAAETMPVVVEVCGGALVTAEGLIAMEKSLAEAAAQ